MNITLVETIEQERRKKGRPRKIKPRASYITIFQPVKFLNPFNTYLLPGEMTVLESNGELHITTGSLCQFKQINHFEYNKNTQMIKVIYEETPQKCSLPWRYLFNRLISLGNKESNEYVKILENYCNKIELIQKNFQKIIAEPEFLNENEMVQIRQYLIRNTFTPPSNLNQIPVSYIKRKFTEKNIHVVEVGANEVFLKNLGYDLETIKSLALKNIVPEINSLEVRLSNFKKHVSGVFPQEACANFLIAKNGSIKRGYFKYQYMTEIVDGSLYQAMYHVYDKPFETLNEKNQNISIKIERNDKELFDDIDEFLDSINLKKYDITDKKQI